MEDVAPELLKRVMASFDDVVKHSEKIKSLTKLIRDGTATYKEANEYSILVGEALAKAYKQNISSDVLPDGKMYYNIAKRVIEPSMVNNYNIIANVTDLVQKALNDNANIGIKPITPVLNQDRIDGIINRVSSEPVYDDVSWILDGPVVNFSQSIVDDSIKCNSEFQGKSGMSPKIVRTLAGGCCEWCTDIAGTYIYPNVPEDVYRRHDRCKCRVEYIPSKGKRVTVHSGKEGKRKYVKDKRGNYVKTKESRTDLVGVWRPFLGSAILSPSYAVLNSKKRACEKISVN